jgi:hypothetical protein
MEDRLSRPAGIAPTSVSLVMEGNTRLAPPHAAARSLSALAFATADACGGGASLSLRLAPAFLWLTL